MQFSRRTSDQLFANHPPSPPCLANDFENRPVHSPLSNGKMGNSMSGMAILENVRRYRTIASLYRQTAVFRPDRKWSLLAQAFEYERLARTELEGYFAAS
jgi:hypothetical protein